MTSKLLLYDPLPGVRHLTLNRPECVNALDEDLCILIDQALIEAEADGAVRCLILTGSGDRGFSSGYDLKELSTYSPSDLQIQNARRYELMWRFAVHPQPIIVANHGVCMGAGAIMAVCADIRLGSEDSVFRFTGNKYGSAMLTWCLPQLVGISRAKEYLMTARDIGSAEACAAGLLNAVCQPDELLSRAVDLAGMIAAHPPSGTRDIKRLLFEGMGLSVRERWRLELETLLAQMPAGAENPTLTMLETLKSGHQNKG